MNSNMSKAVGENVRELSAEQTEVDQEDGVANLLQARNQLQQPNLPTSTSSQDTSRPSTDRRRNAERPQVQYFVEEQVLAGSEVRLLETSNGEMVSTL
jgi:hypothetical protein